MTAVNAEFSRSTADLKGGTVAINAFFASHGTFAHRTAKVAHRQRMGVKHLHFGIVNHRFDAGDGIDILADIF